METDVDCLTFYEPVHGLLADFSDDPFASRLSAWRAGRLSLRSGATHFGFVHSGEAEISCASGVYRIGEGMYFSLEGLSEITGGGAGIVCTRMDYRGMFQVGGPIEERGRLRYIDGCTDSLLISPAVQGDPCLNLLHLPPGTRQTEHTHPSLRMGMIVRGTGECVTPEERTPLHPGLCFVIPADVRHCFHTDSEELAVIAYHPDSDFGPTHQDHPMINRTIIDQPTPDIVSQPDVMTP